MSKVFIIPGAYRKDDPIYHAWCAMKQRCYNEKHPHFHRYGGRGITVCERWLNDFMAFRADMGPRPTGGRYTIERINNDGNYEPANCKWVTAQDQCKNRTKTYTKTPQTVRRS